MVVRRAMRHSRGPRVCSRYLVRGIFFFLCILSTSFSGLLAENGVDEKDARLPSGR